MVELPVEFRLPLLDVLNENAYLLRLVYLCLLIAYPHRMTAQRPRQLSKSHDLRFLGGRFPLTPGDLI